jgi:hypothetical protein
MIAPTMIHTLADAISAASVMQSYVAPVIRTLCVLASLVCVFFLVNGGIHYMASSGKPDSLEHAKTVIRNALIGLLIVLAAAVLTAILSHAYASSGATMAQRLPAMTTVQAAPVSNGLVDIIIKAITGLLNNIIQSIAAPFLKALSFFTTSTPLMADNSNVFNLWLAIVGMADALFVLIVALLGFHVMSAASFGLDEIEFKHLLPRIALIFLLINTSIFAIDGVIELSNVMISALYAGLPAGSVWDVLTSVVKQASELGVAALLIMIAFLIFAVILLIYYVGRLVMLYIGAVLSPILLMLWLVPGFRDFSETAAKTYLTTVFVLFVHVVILQMAASLFAGLLVGSPTHTPDTLMALVVGLATVIALLKTQGVMMQLSYVSVGPRTARRLSSQFMTGVSYLGGNSNSNSKTSSSTVTRYSARDLKVKTPNQSKPGNQSGGTNIAARSPRPQAAPATVRAVRPATGETTVAPPTVKSKELEAS